MSHPADQFPLALADFSCRFAPLLPGGFVLSAKWVREGLVVCPTLLIPVVSILPAKLLEPNALPPNSSTATGVKCCQGKVSACTLVLVVQEVVMELSVATSVGKCFSLLISGHLFAVKFY